MEKQKKALIKLILTALFSALCFIGASYIQVPMPTGKVHLGNMICILAALLIGGVYGGIAGSLGMGLSDIIHGYGPASSVRTFILKFFMGLIAGLVFRFILKKKINVKKLTIIFLIILGVLAITTITLSVISYNNAFTVTYTSIKNGVEVETIKSIKIHWIIPLFISIMFIISIIDLILEKKLGKLSGVALISASAGIAFNIFGEVYIKAVLYYWISASYTTLNDAYLYAIAGLPSTLITSVVTVTFIGFIYYPIYRATKDFNPVDYASQFIDEEKTESEKEFESEIEKEKDATN